MTLPVFPPDRREVVRSRDGIILAGGIVLAIVAVLATGWMWCFLIGGCR